MGFDFYRQPFIEKLEELFKEWRVMEMQNGVVNKDHSTLLVQWHHYPTRQNSVLVKSKLVRKYWVDLS